VSAFLASEEPAGTILDLSSPSLVNEITELDGRLHVLNGLLDASSRFYQVNETIQSSRDRNSALAALQQEPFGYTQEQAEALLEMPMGWQIVAELEQLRLERDSLASRRASLREHVTEVLAFHWFG
jgi:DNA gyrase/topoisomerase IV subunit A